MRRDPPINFRGALTILGHHERPWLDRLNRALGGVLLAAGAVPGIAVLWGWIDQKSEAMGLLRSALDRLADRLACTNGQLRQDLVAAAHTTIVLAAYFDNLRERMTDVYDEAKLSDREKAAVSSGIDVELGAPLIQALYTSRVPIPSASCGFDANVTHVARWAARQHGSVLEFLKGISLSVRRVDNERFVSDVTDRYRSLYLNLAAAVPEFAIWANLTEHAATRNALATLTELLGNGPKSTPRDFRAMVDSANQAALDRPIAETAEQIPVFPISRDIFQTPRYRMVTASPSAHPANEHWWASYDVHDDLTLLLARHFSTPESIERPLLLLGHPGAGKSLFMKAVAASLPAENYTVVRVPLRSVDADLPVVKQIQQALDSMTNYRVTWPSLIDQTHDTIRVVLLDGLDELLQATSHDRTGYLGQVEEFQRIESTMGHPVAVIVASRTLVAERVVIPSGTVMVKLECFNRQQVASWLEVWNHANADVGIRPTTVEMAMVRPELAQQPLLLMMLAVYCADLGVPEPTAEMSQVDLYKLLFELFARREVDRQGAHDVNAAAADHVKRLSIAALGMVNRGAQHITESDLTADLAALGESVLSGKRVLAEFFFIHTSEAVSDAVARSYEFLHATFAEYLVADRVVEILRDVAEGAYDRRNEHEPDDDLLFAMLSHQPLSIQRPSLEFIGALFARLSENEQQRIIRTLNRLLATYHERRPPRRYPNYSPIPIHAIRQIGAYTANLTLLRTQVTPDGFTLREFWPDGAWRSLVYLWESGLDRPSMNSLLTTLQRVDDRVFAPRVPPLNPSSTLMVSRLTGDGELEYWLRLGMAVHRGQTFQMKGSEPVVEWEEAAYSQLLALQAGFEVQHLAELPVGQDTAPFQRIVKLAERVLITECGNWTPEFTVEFLQWLEKLQPSLDPFVYLVAERVHQLDLRWGVLSVGNGAGAALDELHVGVSPEDFWLVEATLKKLLHRWDRTQDGPGL